MARNSWCSFVCVGGMSLALFSQAARATEDEAVLLPALTPKTVMIERGGETVLPAYELLLRLASLDGDLAVLEIGWSGAKGYVGGRHAVGDNGFVPNERHYTRSGTLLPAAKVLYRSHRTCRGNARPEAGLNGHEIVDLRGYANYECRSRFLEQCFLDGSFDAFYDERCDFAPIHLSVGTEVSGSDFSLKFDRSENGTATFTVRPTSSARYGPVLQEDGRPAPGDRVVDSPRPPRPYVEVGMSERNEGQKGRLPALSPEAVQLKERRQVVLADYELRLSVESLEPARAKLAIRWSGADDYVGDRHAVGDNGFAPNPRNYPFTGNLLAAATVLYRSHRTCLGNTRPDAGRNGHEIVDLRGYTNYVCRSRFEEQCFLDRSFDAFYDERCDFAPVWIAVGSEVSAGEFAIKLEGVRDGEASFAVRPLRLERYGPVLAEGDRPSAGQMLPGDQEL